MVNVEKLCKNLWDNLWESRGKVFCHVWKNKFYTSLVGKILVFHVLVEKFYKGFCTQFNRGNLLVLHSFHRPYYYYYYYLYKELI